MKRYLCLLIIIMVSYRIAAPITHYTDTACNACSDIPSDLSLLLYKHIQSFPDNTQLSIAIIDKDSIRYYGVIKHSGNWKTVNNKDKIFEIGSISKVFTATLLSALVREHKIVLDSPIHSFYSFPFKDKTPISFKSLANHSSGLPILPANLDTSDLSNPYKNYDARSLRDYLENHLSLNPSKTYRYSNLGMGLLGYTLGLSQHSTLEQLLQQYIFTPYHMPHTFTNPHHLSIVPGLDAEGKSTPNWNFDVMSGAGGILSTAEDMAAFAHAQWDTSDIILQQTRIPTLSIHKNMRIGLGWHILSTDYGKTLHFHNGGTGGYRSAMALACADKKGIIILSNVSAFHPDEEHIDDLCLDLIKKLIFSEHSSIIPSP